MKVVLSVGVKLVDFSITILQVTVSAAIMQLEVSAALIQLTVSAANNMCVNIFIVIMQVAVSVIYWQSQLSNHPN